MGHFLITILNMSFTASVMVLIVVVLRWLLRLFMPGLPKWCSYVLWGLVLFRLLCPVSITSAFSLFPVSHRPIGQQIIYDSVPAIHSGLSFIDEGVNRILMERMAANPYTSMNPVQGFLYLAAVLWLTGILLFLGINLFLYIRLKKRLQTAVKAEDGVFETEQISMPMVLGLFRPVIYLPFGLPENERKYVLAHERAHIRRFDYPVKLLGFFALTVHFFNPFIWAFYFLMCKDMEMSCDESVLKELGEEEKTNYSMALLAFSAEKSGLVLPLAFGENNTRSRIRNVLNYKKPAFWLRGAAVLWLLAAVAFFLTNPKAKEINIIGGADGATAIFIAGKGIETVAAVPVNAEAVKDIKLPEAEGEQVLFDPASKVVLDTFMDEKIILHGSFGLCIYNRQGGSWKLSHSLDLAKTDSRFEAAEEIEVRELGSQILIGAKKDGGYETIYLYNYEDETVVNADDMEEMMTELNDIPAE